MNANDITHDDQKIFNLLNFSFYSQLLLKPLLTNQSQIKSLIKNNHKTQLSTLKTLFTNNRLELVNICYCYMRASGNSLQNNNKNINYLLMLHLPDLKTATSYFQFILQHYEININNKLECYEHIGAQTAADCLNADLHFSRYEIEQRLSFHYQRVAKKVIGFSCLNRETEMEKARHAFLCIMGLTARLLERPDYFPFLIQFSKSLRLSYRRHIYPDSPADYLGDLPRLDKDKGLVELIMRPLYPSENPYAATMNDFTLILHSNQLFTPFLIDLNQQLESRLPNTTAPILQPQGEYIQFYQYNVPDFKTFRQWRQLHGSDKKNHHSLHRLLLELENREGINLPSKKNEERVPHLYLFVDADVLNPMLIKKNRLFKESPYMITSLIHGIETHRIQLAALRFFIHRGQIRLPEGKTAQDFVHYLLEHNLWTKLIDRINSSGFQSPYFFSSYLRNSSMYPALQRHAINEFFKGIERIFSLYQFDPEDEQLYERLLLEHLSYNDVVGTHLDQNPVLETLRAKKYKNNESGSSPDLTPSIYYKNKSSLFKPFKQRVQLVERSEYYANNFNHPGCPDLVCSYDITSGIVILIKNIDTQRRCTSFAIAHIKLLNLYFSNQRKSNIEKLIQAFEAAGGDLRSASIQLLGGLKNSEIRPQISTMFDEIAAERGIETLIVKDLTSFHLEYNPNEKRIQKLTLCFDNKGTYTRKLTIQDDQVIERQYYPPDSPMLCEGNYQRIVSINQTKAEEITQKGRQFLQQLNALLASGLDPSSIEYVEKESSIQGLCDMHFINDEMMSNLHSSSLS